MSKNYINENFQITLDLKTIALLIVGISSLIGMYFALQKDIEEAKALPEPVLSRSEFDMKDENIRDRILTTQEDIKEIKDELKKIREQLMYQKTAD
jgi:hypothetical protein